MTLSERILDYFLANKQLLRLEDHLKPSSDTTLNIVQDNGKYELDKVRLMTLWYEAFLHFFVDDQSPSNGSSPASDRSVARHSAEALDDMLFFVSTKQKDTDQNYRHDEEKDERVFVKRKSGVERVVQAIKNDPVDWPQTFFLNTICHGHYILVLSVCRQATEPTNHKKTSRLSEKKDNNIQQQQLVVLKQQRHRVYASHHEIMWDLAGNHPTAFPSSYPTIHFGCVAETMDEAMEVGTGQIFAVELFGIIKKMDDNFKESPDDAVQLLPSFSALNEVFCVVNLFQGAVPFDALKRSFRAKSTLSFSSGASLLSSVTSALASHIFGSSTDKSNPTSPTHKETKKQSSQMVLMRGPHGKGMSQVSISEQGKSLLHARLSYISLPWQSIMNDLLEHHQLHSHH